MIPKYYEFYNPVKIVSGHNALDSLSVELEYLHVKYPMIVTDPTIEKIGLLDIVLSVLKDTPIRISAVYSDVPSDSSVETVNKLAQIYKQSQSDGIIAIGGGSVIDTAKGLNILISERVNDLSDLVGVDRLEAKQQPFIAIPTTSGTGSEATLVAVIADNNRNIKMPFTSYRLLPNVAILDTRMTLSLPPKITAATGMDALTHAIEAYTCLQKNPVSDAFAVAAIKLINKYLIKAVEKPSDKEARLAMANASLLAGVAFSNSMVGGVHAIGHALGAVAHLHHGMAMSVLLTHVMQFNSDRIGEFYSELLPYFADCNTFAGLSSEDRFNKTIEEINKIRMKLKDLTGLPLTLSEAGVDKSVFEEVANTAINDGAIMPNPKQIDYDDVVEILNKAY